ncbi:MAG TPA: hypothetical protein VM120_07280 [Bryobacteraceae bacterium]|nr:hypothetical protein [Bryobacteraceae bacterium]
MNSHFTRRAFLATGLLAAQQPRPLIAGAAVVNITPALGSHIAGNMRFQIAEDVHDELHAKALVLDNGAARLAFVVCDSCAIAPEVIARAKSLIEKNTGISPERVLISATHTHSAPAAARLFQSEPDPSYLDFLSVRIADGVRRAVNRMQAARIGWGTGRADKLVFNRRYLLEPGGIPANPFGDAGEQVRTNPGIGNRKVLKVAGPVDPEVCLLAVQGTDGKPLCALGSFALHYVGGVPARVISADYFAVWSSGMQRRLNAGPDFVGMLANGCSGNINNVDVNGPSTPYAPFSKMREVAEALAAESERVWKQIQFRDWVELDSTFENVDLATRRPTSAEVEAAKKILPEDTNNVSDVRHVYAKETIQLQSYPARVAAPVQTFRIGDLGIATFPGEAFVELGLEVKQKSPFKPTFLIELANSYLGYIPTVEAHRQGGYETWRAKSSFLEVEAAPKLVEAALRGLQRLKR